MRTIEEIIVEAWSKGVEKPSGIKQYSLDTYGRTIADKSLTAIMYSMRKEGRLPPVTRKPKPTTESARSKFENWHSLEEGDACPIRCSAPERITKGTVFVSILSALKDGQLVLTSWEVYDFECDPSRLVELLNKGEATIHNGKTRTKTRTTIRYRGKRIAEQIRVEKIPERFVLEGAWR